MGQYSLEKVEELHVNSLFPLSLIDYFPSERIYLGYVNKFSDGSEVALVNEDGEIMISKNLKGEGPEEYTGTLNGLAFTENGDVWVQTTHLLLRYDQNLNLIERIKYDSGLSYHLYGRPKKFPWFQKENNSSEFSWIVNPTRVGNFLREISFERTKLIEIFSLKEDSTYQIAPISDRSHYRDIDMTISAMYAPIYYLERENNELYLSTKLDDEITVYDLDRLKVISRIKISHGEFNSLKTIPITNKSLPSYKNRITLAAVNERIYSLDENIIALEYIREIPYGTYEKRIADDPKYHHSRDPEYRRLIFFDQNKQISNDIALPNGTIELTLPGNRLLVKLIDPDVEEDFIRFGIYKLIKSNE
ncbi:MAG: hypothetical protein R6V72_11085 [Cyclobacterium sp.]|uniref:hypothetical protein n=1 Tax=Cyclobacterium sp. TaxID=1966343 RepID=UPI003970595E